MGGTGIWSSVMTQKRRNHWKRFMFKINHSTQQGGCSNAKKKTEGSQVQKAGLEGNDCPWVCSAGSPDPIRLTLVKLGGERVKPQV